MITNDDRLLSRRQLSELTGLSIDTLGRMARRGNGPPVTRISERRIGYRVLDLRSWLDAQRCERASGEVRG
jgi:predicted DNA-binding transcriptional regulator AlpA